MDRRRYKSRYIIPTFIGKPCSTEETLYCNTILKKKFSTATDQDIKKVNKICIQEFLVVLLFIFFLILKVNTFVRQFNLMNLIF